MDAKGSSVKYPDLRNHWFTQEERQRRLRLLQETRPEGPLWVFAFGSLMWNPCFRYDRREIASLEGWQRKFHIWTTLARGTPERPGLGLCIEPGGKACKGVAYRLLEANEKDDWQSLWDREMVSGIYKAVWTDMTLRNGQVVKALAFVVDPTHRQYAGGMSLADMSEIIAGASGKYGRCSDYLKSTVAELAKIGVVEEELDCLLAAVEARLEEK